ncbi:hypothetical protein AX15_002155 [Amanita polypyramis BW_CC]|nr:hypothetical protein AX15_002155 [Amanita polypyramis BW_CC]
MPSPLDRAEFNISLEKHLVDVLRPLHPRLPDNLAEKVAPYLSGSPPVVIPYSLLFSISRWTRSDAGLNALHAQNPSLDPQSYSMVSLLAGTTTSPERFFGTYIPPRDPAEVQAEKKRERKAITTLLNALLSIAGSAFAAWWAAEKTGWRNEWRVLLSLFVAVVVAVSEAVLFLLWQSRAIKVADKKRRIQSAIHKKVDPEKDRPTLIKPDNTAPTSVTDIGVSELRQRK